MPDRDLPQSFRPIPLLHNPHLQTVVGFMWKGRSFRHPTRRRELLLSDGDRLVLHDSVPEGWSDGDPVALLIHGMGGDSNSGYVQRVSARLFAKSVRVVRMDLRGTGAGFGLAEKFYHAGRSGDVRESLHELHRWAPSSPLWLVGFSLGGSLAVKAAGEADELPLPGLSQMVAVAPPIDLVRCSELISLPKNRIYDRFFANQLVRLAKIRQQHYPNPPLPEFPRRLSIRQFDDLFTAPRCGFADAMDYYRKTSSYPFVPGIRVPALVIAARDDPFVAISAFDELKPPKNMQLEIHDRGGHLGFLGYDGTGGVRWVERRIVDWLLAK
jgi:uncharacterized protein